MSFLYGGPPKVVWIRVGNCSTDAAARLLRRDSSRIEQFVEIATESLLILD